MNIRDIHLSDIKEFLRINHLTGSYNEAIKLINSNEFIETRPIKLWLMAYQDEPAAAEDLKIILFYKHQYSYLYLPEELLATIFMFSPMSLNHHFHTMSIKIKNNLHYRKQKAYYLLQKHGYDIIYHPLVFKTLYPKSGQVYYVDCFKLEHKINIPEPVIKIIPNKQLFLTETGKLFMYAHQLYILDVCLPITDVIYHKKFGYILLSRGVVYYGYPEMINAYLYRARCCRLSPPNLTVLMDNVIHITASSKIIYMVKTNGDVYNHKKMLWMRDVNDLSADDYYLTKEPCIAGNKQCIYNGQLHGKLRYPMPFIENIRGGSINKKGNLLLSGDHVHFISQDYHVVHHYPHVLKVFLDQSLKDCFNYYVIKSC